MDLPKLLSVNESFFPYQGGAETRSYETFRRLAKMGHEIKVLTNGFDGQVEIPGVEIECVTDLKQQEYFRIGSRRLLGVYKFSSAVKESISKNQSYDIYNFDEFPLVHAIKGTQSVPKGKAKFFTWHEVLKDYYYSKNFFWRKAAYWEKKVTEAIENHIAVSDRVERILTSTYRPKNTWVVNNGVDTKKFKCKEAKEWGKIIYVGRMEPHKRLDLLIKKFSKHSEFQIDIIGSGSQSEYLKNLVNGSKNIHISGHLSEEEIVKEMKSSWLFIMPSYREGFSIASLEAMAANVPVITIDSPYNLAVNEIIRHGYNGIVSDNFDEMMVKIDQLHKDEGMWNNLSQNAREFSLSYDWDIVSARLSEIYRKVVNDEN